MKLTPAALLASWLSLASLACAPSAEQVLDEHRASARARVGTIRALAGDRDDLPLAVPVQPDTLPELDFRHTAPSFNAGVMLAEQVHCRGGVHWRRGCLTDGEFELRLGGAEQWFYDPDCSETETPPEADPLAARLLEQRLRAFEQLDYVLLVDVNLRGSVIWGVPPEPPRGRITGRARLFALEGEALASFPVDSGEIELEKGTKDELREQLSEHFHRALLRSISRHLPGARLPERRAFELGAFEARYHELSAELRKQASERALSL